MALMLTAATFVFVAIALVAGYQSVAGRSMAEQRLEVLVPAPRRRDDGAGRAAWVRHVLAAVGAIMAGRSERALTQRLEVAGFRGPNVALAFLGTQTLLTVGPAVIVLVPEVASGHSLARALMLAGFAWVGGYVVVNQWLAGRITRRVRRISAGLPDTLDLLVVCLEAGLGLNATIARVGEERAALDDPLGDELALVAFELRSGRNREDALRALAERNGVDDLKALVGLVIQSDRLGTSLVKTLRVHSDLLRTKRRQRAEEAARRLPVKMLFPVAVFVLPALFLIAAGPALLRVGQLLNSLGVPARVP
ncbi:MAG: type II secretion system F family protein [Candidatus Binatia bacterium]